VGLRARQARDLVWTRGPTEIHRDSPRPVRTRSRNVTRGDGVDRLAEGPRRTVSGAWIGWCVCVSVRQDAQFSNREFVCTVRNGCWLDIRERAGNARALTAIRSREHSRLRLTGKSREHPRSRKRKRPRTPVP